MNVQLSYYLDRVSKYAGFMAAFLVLLLSLLVAYDAAMRYLFSSGSIALQEVEWHLFDVVFLPLLKFVSFLLSINSNLSTTTLNLLYF